MLDPQEKETLERLIDRHSLQDVLQAISEIAAEKANHVRTNWQDRGLADRWDRASATVERAADKVPTGI